MNPRQARRRNGVRPGKRAAAVTPVTVRPITVGEAFPLRRRHLRPSLPAASSRYAGDDHPAAIHLGAFADVRGSGKLVAVVSFLPRTEHGEISTAVYELQGLVTVPWARNQGIGAHLVAEGITELISRGVSCLWCDGRTPAKSFYERLGFSAVGAEFVTPATGPHYRFVKELGKRANGSGEPEREV